MGVVRRSLRKTLRLGLARAGALGAALGIAVLIVAGRTKAAGPLGPAFRVNTYTPGIQQQPSVAMRPDGGFVVVWDSGPHPLDSSDRAIIGQRYASSGTPLGGEFLVNSETLGGQRRPSIAMNASGNFVVTWDTAYIGVSAQRFDASGARLGGEIPVSTSGLQSGSVAMDAAGGFVAAFSRPDSYPRPPNTSVGLRRFDSSGTPLAPTFIVQSGAGNTPQLTMQAEGAFVVTWGTNAGFGQYTFAQRFRADGTPRGSWFKVSAAPDAYDDWVRPSVAVDRYGEFVIVWKGNTSDFDGIIAQRYDGIGRRIGGIFHVGGDGNSSLDFSRVAMDEEGNFVVVRSDWTGRIHGHVFDRAGARVGSEFLPSTAIDFSPKRPVVSMDGSGDFIVVWQDSDEIYAQRWCQHGSVPDMRLSQAGAGALLHLTWGNPANVDGYVVYEDASVSGTFETVTGTAPDGTVGITIPMPPSNRFYLVAAHSAACGDGTKR